MVHSAQRSPVHGDVAHAEHDATASGVAGASPAVAATRTAGQWAGCSSSHIEILSQPHNKSLPVRKKGVARKIVPQFRWDELNDDGFCDHLRRLQTGDHIIP